MALNYCASFHVTRPRKQCGNDTDRRWTFQHQGRPAQGEPSPATHVSAHSHSLHADLGTPLLAWPVAVHDHQHLSPQPPLHRSELLWDLGRDLRQIRQETGSLLLGGVLMPEHFHLPSKWFLEREKKFTISRRDAEAQRFEINKCSIFFVDSAPLRLCARYFCSFRNFFTAS